MSELIYFGHPINVYNTPLEEFLIQQIQNAFPEVIVENPNQSKHDEGYNRYKQNRKRGMDYFFKEVLPKMDKGIFLPFVDGKFGLGVYGEAEFLQKEGKLIYEIKFNGKINSLTLEPSMCLSKDETRARVYNKAFM